MPYNIYPTLLDNFNFFNAFPSIEKEQELIDKINRVKFEKTNQVQLGLAFEGLINSIIKGEGFMTEYDGFTFKEDVIKSVLHEIGEDEMQKHVSEVININGVDVNFYGFVDYYRPSVITDLKTGAKYKLGKYKFYTQRHIYPLCIPDVKKFTFLFTDFEGVVKEPYFFSKRESLKVLSEIVPRFIDFIESKRDIITDTKIFGDGNGF
jgi:hypothetical protein